MSPTPTDVFGVLVDECGANDSLRADFLHHWPGCREYRFQGFLGFGGKCYEPDRHHPNGFVSCYREDETPGRLAMIARANERLDALSAAVTALAPERYTADCPTCGKPTAVVSDARTARQAASTCCSSTTEKTKP